MKQLNITLLEVVMSKKVFLTLALITGLPFLSWFVDNQSTTLGSIAKANPSSNLSVPSKEVISVELFTLERGWIKNEGQWDQRALFSAPGYLGTTWVTKDGELLHVAVKKEECKEKTAKAKTCPAKSWVISERWVDGKVQDIKGEEELGTKVSYFIGNDPSKYKSGLSIYRYVSLGEVWPGVEVKLKATQKTVERLFYVKPGADLSKIQVQLNGAKGLKLSKDGEIIIQTDLGDLKLSKPIAWQEKDGKKFPVKVSYKLIDKNRYSFVVAKADPSLPIVIDPILQSTYLGGAYDDKAYAIAIHPITGDVYVAGVTTSADFPKTIGEYIGGSDAFVSRLNSSLTQIYQSTYLGGSYSDVAYAIAINPTTGDVYVAGETTSDNFPKTFGGAQSKGYCPGNIDAFVSRLNSDLTQILQSTYLGTDSNEVIYAIAIHPITGDIYVAGYTFSEYFPRTAGGAQSKIDLSTQAAFVSRLNSDLTQILQSTYLAGKDLATSNEAHALAINPSTGDVYVTGITTAAYFPKTAGGAQPGKGGGYYDAFVSRLNSDLTQILQSTYLGGVSDDGAYAIAIHPTTGDVYVAGYTFSGNFPGTKSGAQKTMKGDHDAFVSRLNSGLTQILQSTYLGGSSSDNSYAIAIHPMTGEIYVAGTTNSSDFPKVTGGAQKYCNKCGYNNTDAFVARLSSDLTKIFQST
ncbi:MAG: SBBP repeat-containing protein, partial [Thermocrinis sp.]|nr:SBBP repeat-containing protein [Thermocrinis sp.]